MLLLSACGSCLRSLLAVAAAVVCLRCVLALSACSLSACALRLHVVLTLIVSGFYVRSLLAILIRLQ